MSDLNDWTPPISPERTPRQRRREAVINVLLVPVWVAVGFICVHSLEDYSDVGNLVLLALIMFFALVGWWYCEDRDKRHAQPLPDRSE